MSEKFETALARSAARVTAFLEAWLTETPKAGEAGRHPVLVEAMRHGVLNGGKRFRPFLVYECAGVGGSVSADEVTPAAAALELIHCYSLVHDDLPAMDNDDLRRGKPTVHVAYNEATAILAGDALLTEAFGVIASADYKIAPEMKCVILGILARDAGTGGMVGGQSLDLASENSIVDEETIAMTQALKTGALIRAATEVGAVLGGLSADDQGHIVRFGEVLGRMFQIADDLLDLTADTVTLGKTVGKDIAAGKQTLVSIHGTKWARDHLNLLRIEAVDCVKPFGNRADILIEAVDFVVSRKS
ncbi:MAG: polyprenyl synthetase family protein [Pseudomonadota bacterium]